MDSWQLAYLSGTPGNVTLGVSTGLPSLLVAFFRLGKIRTCSRTANILHFIYVPQADSPARYSPLCLPSPRVVRDTPTPRKHPIFSIDETLIGPFRNAPGFLKWAYHLRLVLSR